jgi:hypothetical protein
MGRTWILALPMAVLLLAGACSGDGDDPADTGGDATASGEVAEEGMQAFAECMRENGVEDFPDPDADGGFQSAEGLRDLIQDNPDAVEACQEHLEAAVGEDEGERGEMFAEYADCMRENGVEDFPDLGADGVDPELVAAAEEDPEWDAAYEACQELIEAGSSE